MIHSARIKSIIALTCFLHAIAVSGSCSKKPVWLPDLQILLANTNREIEEVLPSLAEGSPPADVLAGFKRLDKSADRIVADLQVLLQKNPDLVQQRVSVWLYLGDELKRLGQNFRRVIILGNHWEKQFGKRGEFHAVTQSILRKGKRAEKLLQEAGND